MAAAAAAAAAAVASEPNGGGGIGVAHLQIRNYSIGKVIPEDKGREEEREEVGNEER